MAISVAEQLTAQFYEWEVRGRGWHYAPYAVDLEPPFHPFFGHFIQAPKYVDDGKRPTLLSRFVDVLNGSPPTPHIEQYTPPAIELLPFEDSEPLEGFVINIGCHAKPSGELMEQFLIMLSGIHEAVSFEIIADSTRIRLQLICRAQYRQFVYSQLKIYFPDASIIPVEEHHFIDYNLPLYTCDYGLHEEHMRPINTAHTHSDALISFFGVCDQLQGEERVIFQVLFNGTQNHWADSMERAVSDGRKGSFFLDGSEMPGLVKEKCSKPLFAVTIRVLAQDVTMDGANSLHQRVSYTIVHASTSAHNRLVPLITEEYSLVERVDDFEFRQSHRSGMLLNSRELATFVHFPAFNVSKKLMLQQSTSKAAPSHLIDQPYCLGTNAHQGITVEVGLNTAQRTRHIHIIGATGTGKSTLLKNIILQDIETGEGCCVVEPHGDLIDELLFAIPEHRIADVVLIDPSDIENPVGLNILSAHSDLERELLASDLVALFRRFSTSWGDQMNSVFANAISAFVYNTEIGTLGDLRKFLIEQSFRNDILKTCTDPDIVYYWHKEYPLLKSSSLGSILTRLDSFLRPKVIRAMVCQKHSLNFQHIMDNNKIVLVKLSHGLIGEENSHLLGAFIVSKLQQTAMARQTQVREQRVPFYCYIDEFQHYITPSMGAILSGGRKYALGLILAHQSMHDVSTQDVSIANSLIANAGTRIIFNVGDTDAKRLQESLSDFSAEDVQNLPVGEAIVRVNTNDQDFNIAISPYVADMISYKDQIITHSRNTYCVPVSEDNAPVQPVATQPAPVTITPLAPISKKDEPPTSPPTEKREHRYLQFFIKKMAEEHGYKTTIEVLTPDGRGLIDIVLEKEEQRIAVEISVTTTAEWELHNIQKCLAAGFHSIIVCVSDSKKQRLITEKIKSVLPSNQQSRIQVVNPEEIHQLFMQSATPSNTVSTMKGYRVKVQYEEKETNEGSGNIIKRILKNAKK